ncbi:MAG: DUF2341 domain-containing protein, partial [Nitrospinota bacterium]
QSLDKSILPSLDNLSLSFTRKTSLWQGDFQVNQVTGTNQLYPSIINALNASGPLTIEGSLFSRLGSVVASDSMSLIYNSPPKIISNALLTAEVEKPYRYHVFATDLDSDNLYFALLSGPEGMSMDPLSGLVSWTPSSTQTGLHPVEVTANDGKGGTFTQRYEITITAPPRFAPLSHQTIREGETLSFTVTAIDPDTDLLSIYAPGLPENALFFDSGNGSGEFYFYPDLSQAGTYEVQFIADDGLTRSFASVSITVENINQGPVLAAIQNQNVQIGETLSFSITATDSDNDSLLFTSSGLPLNSNLVDNRNGTASFTFTPNETQAGEHLIEITVSDGEFSDSDVFSVHVNHFPVIDSLSYSTPARYSITEDFHKGSGTGVTLQYPGVVRNGNEPYIWFANKATGVVTKMDSGTRKVVGTYYSLKAQAELLEDNLPAQEMPLPRGSALHSPGVVTIDLAGNAYVLNQTAGEGQGTLTKIVHNLNLASDFNGNGAIETSSGVALLENDEMVSWTAKVGLPGATPRTMGVSPENHVWVGTLDGFLYKFHESTGLLLESLDVSAEAGFSVHIDELLVGAEGNIFILECLSGKLLKISPKNMPGNRVLNDLVLPVNPGAMLLDNKGILLVSDKYPTTTPFISVNLDTTPERIAFHSSPYSGAVTGMVIDRSGSIWASMSDLGKVLKFSREGIFVQEFSVLPSMDTLAIDSENNIWAISSTTPHASIINPHSNLIEQSSLGEISDSSGDLTGNQTIRTLLGSTMRSFDGPSQPAPFLGTWKNRIKMVVDSSKIDEDLFDFPLLISLSTESGISQSDLSQVVHSLGAKSNRKKIAVTTGDGKTQCFVEVEKWDASTGRAWLWVKVPQISSAKDTELYLYYDRTQADNTIFVGDSGEIPAQAVWSNEYSATWHLNPFETNGTLQVIDSTSNQNHGLPNSNLSASNSVSGQVGDALNFAVEGAIWVGENTMPVDTFTLSAWVKTDLTHEIDMESTSGVSGIAGQNYVFYPANSRDSNARAGLSIGTNGISVYEHTGHYLPSLAVYAGPVGTSLNHVAVVYTNRQPSIFLNGNLVKTGLQSLKASVLAPITIGGDGYGFFDGIIDEARISQVARTASWLKTAYLSEKDTLIRFEGIYPNKNNWKVIADCEKENCLWDRIQQTWFLPQNSFFYVEARVENSKTRLTQAPWQKLKKDLSLDQLPPGRFIETKFTFVENSQGQSPILGRAVLSSFNYQTLQENMKLKVFEGETLKTKISASDLDGDTLILTASQLPRFAGWKDNGDGTASLIFFPSPGDQGTYSFNIQANDGKKEISQSYTIEVLKGNFSPEFVRTPSIITASESQITTVLIQAEDPEAKQIHLFGGELPNQVRMSDNGDGTALLTVSPGEPGQFPITIIATDGESFATHSIHLSITDGSPVITPVANQTIMDGDILSIPVSAQDPDSASLILSQNGLPEGAAVTESGFGAWTINFTPAYEDKGTYSVTLVVTDDEGQTDSVTFTITVEGNKVPIITPTSDIPVQIGEQLTQSISAFDLENEPLNITVTGLPSGATLTEISNGEWVLEYTPGAGSVGFYPITIDVTDGIGTSSQAFNIIVNGAPKIQPIESYIMNPGERLTVPITVSDGEPDTLTLNTSILPPNTAITETGYGTWNITFSPTINETGVHSISLNVSDGYQSTDESFTLVVSSSSSQVIPTGTNLSGDYSSSDVIIDGGAVSGTGSFTFKNLTLINNCTLGAFNSSTNTAHSISITVLETLVIDESCTIDFSKKGYPAGRTVGNSPIGSSSPYNGASYGGLGGKRALGSVNGAYGIYRDPKEPGSGGGSQWGGAGRGGGVVRITAGSVTLNGSILADGESATDYGAGAGSGGSIYINTGTLSGNGIITSNGGDAHDGAGGGGRIAIYYSDISRFNINNVNASGGISAISQNGGAGTLYLNDKALLTERLFIDGRFIPNPAISPLIDPVIENLIVKGGARVRGANHVNVSGDITVDNAILYSGGGISASSMSLLNNGLLTHYPATSTRVYKSDVTVSGNLIIDDSSGVNVDNLGYLQSHTLGNTTTGSSSQYNGASYGGLGGKSSTGFINAAYGSYKDPNEHGSGGGSRFGDGGNGGGLIRITAGSVTLYGSISADGEDTTADGAGGGSGGGIYLNTGSLSGNGLISSRGGDANDGAGGGGRVAIYYNDISGFNTNNIDASGGESAVSQNGGAGTVYLKDKTLPTGTLVVDGKSILNPGISPLTDPVIENLTVRGGARVRGASPVNINGNVTVDDATLYSGGGISAHTMTLVNSALLTHYPTTTTRVYRADVTVSGNLDIDHTSSVNVSHLGYLKERTSGNSTTGSSGVRNGGSYGGLGGKISGVVNAAYGNFADPNEVGSGGGTATGVGGSGGGLVRITAGSTTLNGTILADGQDMTEDGAGAGSGGGIFLDTGILSGSGKISSRGGHANDGAGG